MVARWRRGRKPTVGSALELGGSLAAVAIGTPLPLGSVAKFVSAFVASDPTEAAKWEERFVGAATEWLAGSAIVQQRLGGDVIHEWDARLLAEFNERGAAFFVGSDREARTQAVDIIARAMFVPLVAAGWDDSRAAAEAFLVALPELLLSAAGNGEFAALRGVLGEELRQVLSAIDALSERLPAPMGDRAAMELYLAALGSVLDYDPWARIVGGPTQTLETGFEARRARVQGKDETIDVETAADRYERLVLLGEPGSGKSWVARHLAIRVADEAASTLDGAPPGMRPDVVIPLFAPAAAVVDAPADVAPWEALARTAVGGLTDRIGADGAATLRSRLDHPGGHYMVFLDGLDEAARHADTRRLERLLDTPGRTLRIVLTSRPGAWRLQLPLETEQPHAVMELEPLTNGDVHASVSRLLVERPAARDTLLDRLGRDAQLATLARSPLACVMLCAAVNQTGEVPRSRTQLFGAIVTLLLRATWREELPDAAVTEARRMLKNVALEAAVDDPTSGLGRWGPSITVNSDMIGAEALECVDNVLPIPVFRPAEATQTRRFIHESIRAHMVAEAAASLSTDAAAGQLRHHLWFDPDWAEVVPSALALNAERDDVLSRLLDIEDRPPAWDDVLRLDGIGELRWLLLALAQETNSGAWAPTWRDLITRAAHEHLADDVVSPLRLELVRGGWPDDHSREDHLDALAAGEPWWPSADVAAGVASLELSQEERRDLAHRLTRRLATGSAGLERAAFTLRALCGSDLTQPLEDASATLAQQFDTGFSVELLSALALLPFSPEHGRRAATAVLARLDEIEPDDFMAASAGDFLAWVPRLTTESDVLERATAAAARFFTAEQRPGTLEMFAPAFPLLRRDPIACEAALRNLLMSFGGADSYERGELEALVRKLVPAAEAPDTILSALLIRPVGEWPVWAPVVDAMARLAEAAEGDIAAMGADRLSAAPLAELARLAELLDRLNPDPHLREVAGSTLVERLRATEPERILHVADALQALRPSGHWTEAANVLHGKLDSASGEALRAAIAPAILRFVDRGPAHDAAIDALIAAVSTGDIVVLNVIRDWATGEDATPVQRSRVFRAFLDLLRGRRQPGVGSDLVRLAANDDERAEAVAVLLERAREDPHNHPADWLRPAATLGATKQQLEEANSWVIAALPDMHISQGSANALIDIWATTPPTEAQTTRAAGHLVDLLASDQTLYVDDVVRLLAQLKPPAELWEAAEKAVRRRVGDRADRYFATRAMQVFEPGFGVPTASERLADLAKAFYVDRASVLLRDMPETRDDIVALLISWAKAGGDYGFSADQLERLADDLCITLADIGPLQATQSGGWENLRALARSARRRCDGESWRAFLREQFDRDPSIASRGSSSAAITSDFEG